jgi:hypothetical protein
VIVARTNADATAMRGIRVMTVFIFDSSCGKIVHKEHEESQRKKLFASLRELCGQIILFLASQRDMKAPQKISS